MANRGGNRIEIVITAVTRGLEQGLRGAIRLVRDFGSTIRGIGTTAANMWRGFTQGVFFAREALSTLINTANALFDVLLRGSIDARRFEVTLTNITGNGDTARQMMESMEQTAETLGVRFEEVAASGQQLAVAARNADGSFDLERWNELQSILRDFSALRPDVPMQLMARGVTAAAAGDMSTLTRLLDVNVNQLLGLRDAADEVLERGGQLQGVAEVQAAGIESTAQGGIDALNQLRDAVGATGLSEQLAGEFEGVTGQIREEFKDVIREIGDEILPVLTEKLQDLLDFYRDNEDEIEDFAEDIGRVVASLIDDIDWGKIAGDAERLAEAVERIFNTAQQEVRQGGVGNITVPGTNTPFGNTIERLFNPDTGIIGGPANPFPGLLGRGNSAPLATNAHSEALPPRTVNVNVPGDAANMTLGQIMADGIRQAFTEVFGGEVEVNSTVPHANLYTGGKP